VRQLEADYLIVGAGAVAMAFADTLLTDSDASLIMVDRRHRPGGHWNDAYPFVRLHSPSLFYGVNSRRLGSERLEQTGLNRGFCELASSPEICAYFEAVMREQFLPSGRVTYLPMSEYAGDGEVISRVAGSRTRVRARRVVDATYADTRLASTHPPGFSVAAGVRLLPPHELPAVAEPYEGCVIIGAGKTAMDAAVWLLENGAPPDRITWIRPRDAWMLPRENFQPTAEGFAPSIGGLAAELEAASNATSVPDLFERLEAAGLLKRIDPEVTPTMYRCAIVSSSELELMRRITRVVRLGHVEAIEPDRVVLEGGVLHSPPNVIYVNCTADGIPSRAPQPIFQRERILLQYVRRCLPTLSGAFVAHIEATRADEDEKNSLCAPIPAPHNPLDWLRMHLSEAANRLRWSEHPELQAWFAGSRLDPFTGLVERAMKQPTAEQAAILERYRKAARPAYQRLAELLEGADTPSSQRAARPLKG